MPLTSRAGHAIWWEESGDPSAPPLLLIMGLALSSRGWDTLPRRLSQRFRVLVFDNRGTGRSGRARFRSRMADFADDAATVLDAAGVGSAHVFGISMGGMIAQEFALRHPARLRSLALGCTFACWRTSRPRSWSTNVDLFLLHLRLGGADRVSRLLVSPEWHARNPGKAMGWIARAERTTPRSGVAQLIAIAAHACESRLGHIRAPTLVITGDRDRLVPPENSATLLRAIPGAKLLVLPGAGHAFPLEREEDTVRAISEHCLAAETRPGMANAGAPI